MSHSQATKTASAGPAADLERAGALPVERLDDREVELEVSKPSGEEVASVVTRSTDPLKRALDIVCSVVGLVLTLPAWVVLPVWIKLEDGGPVFYTQERVGKGGEHFTSWKFRSMEPREECEGPLRQAECETHRITGVGGFMRACALDELPQLLNILRGDMSLVGPRPLLPEEVESRSEDGRAVRLAELPGFEERHSVRPGLTGLSQTRLARDVPHEQKFRQDVRYVRERTLWLDVKLILRSVLISLLGRWPEIERSGRSGTEAVAVEGE